MMVLCVYTPVISIVGAADTTISVATTWTDPYATAANIDGAVVLVTDVSDVDASQVGDYTVSYSATNDNGTTTVTRMVHVVVNQDTWLGDWNVSDNCGGGTGLALNGSPNVIAGGNAEQILITDFFSGITGSYGTAICQLDGELITVAEASDGAPGGLGDIIYSGFGSMNSDGLSFHYYFYLAEYNSDNRRFWNLSSYLQQVDNTFILEKGVLITPFFMS